MPRGFYSGNSTLRCYAFLGLFYDFLWKQYAPSIEFKYMSPIFYKMHKNLWKNAKFWNFLEIQIMIGELGVFRKRYLYQFIWIYFRLLVFMLNSNIKIQESILQSFKILVPVTIIFGFSLLLLQKTGIFWTFIKIFSNTVNLMVLKHFSESSTSIFWPNGI